MDLNEGMLSPVDLDALEMRLSRTPEALAAALGADLAGYSTNGSAGVTD